MFFHYLLQAIMFVSGITALAASLFDWEWFFTTKNAEPIIKSIGRKNGRILYGIAGIALIAAATYFYFRISDL